MVCWSWHTASG